MRVFRLMLSVAVAVAFSATAAAQDSLKEEAAKFKIKPQVLQKIKSALPDKAPATATAPKAKKVKKSKKAVKPAASSTAATPQK